jgi:hypothetical protein
MVIDPIALQITKVGKYSTQSSNQLSGTNPARAGGVVPAKIPPNDAPLEGDFSPGQDLLDVLGVIIHFPAEISGI